MILGFLGSELSRFGTQGLGCPSRLSFLGTGGVGLKDGGGVTC